jgi:membrane protease subunit (stomatin/prohibitin family)
MRGVTAESESHQELLMMNRSIWITAGLATLLVSACSSQKEPASKAIEKIDNTMAMIHDPAKKYSPDALPGVEAQVAAIKQTYAKGDYAGVLTQAPAVNTAVSNLRTDAMTKQSAAESEQAKVKQQWRTLSAEVPKMVAGLHTQVDTLSNGHSLPKGVTKASFATVKDSVTSLDAMWTEANNTVSTGDYAGAVTKGQAVKDKATELMHTLGMKQS